MSRHQQHASEQLLEENRVLCEQLGSKRLSLTDDQRRRLAAKGAGLASIATFDTFPRWH